MKILRQAEQWPFRVAAGSPHLPGLWKDFSDWHTEALGGDSEYTPRDSVQSWGNVEEYLKDRHGLSAYDNEDYFTHPTTIDMAKLHSMAQGKDWADGTDAPIPDDDLLQGAALGLLKIRKQHKPKEVQ